MEWTADVSAGDWLRERIDDPWRWTMHDVVPRGFEAYARVFHPAWIQEIPGGRMPDPDDWVAASADEQSRLRERIVERDISWREAAAIFDSVMHPHAQWSALTRQANTGGTITAPDGQWIQPPEQGHLDPDALASLASVLAEHTSTPADGIVALWEGHGALLGHMGVGPSRTFFQVGDPADPVLSRHNEMLGTGITDAWNNVFRRKTWQEGILSREVSEGARLELPNRAHVLFRGGVAELARPDWPRDVPWRDRPAEEMGFDPSALSPSLVWPDDHAWVLVTEVDFDSTVIGGSRELIAALTAVPDLEVLEILEGASLTDDSDEVNR
jgi:hypothetical protein